MGPLIEKEMAAVERLWARPSILSLALRLQIQNKTALVGDLPFSHRRRSLLSFKCVSLPVKEQVVLWERLVCFCVRVYGWEWACVQE